MKVKDRRYSFAELNHVNPCSSRSLIPFVIPSDRLAQSGILKKESFGTSVVLSAL